MREWKVLGVVAYALFMDYFLFGLTVPLMPFTPVGKLSADRLALLYGSYALGLLTATPLVGYLGDRFGCKRPMIAGVVLSVVATLLFWASPSYGALHVARFFQGAASAATWTCGLALVAEHYPVRRVETMGYALVGSTAGAMLGPLAGGELFNLGGFHLPFIITAGMVCVDLLMRILLLPDRRTAAATASVPLRALLADRAILIPSLAILLAAFGWGIIEPLLPDELSKFGTDAAAIGLAFTVANVAYGLSTPAVSWVAARVPVRVVSSSGVVAMAVILPLLGLAENIVAAGAALCLLAIAFAFTLIPTTAELGNAVDRRGLSCYAAVYAVYNVAYSVGMTATDSLASVAASSLSFFQVLLCTSVVLVLCVPWLLQKDAAAAAEPVSS